MKFNVYCYFDKRAEAFSIPRVSHYGKEDFITEVNRNLKACKDEQMLLKYNDLVLYRIGIFDDETGHIEPESIRLCEFGAICEKLLSELHPVKVLAKGGVDDA